jgi:hypothetical protein
MRHFANKRKKCCDAAGEIIKSLLRRPTGSTRKTRVDFWRFENINEAYRAARHGVARQSSRRRADPTL